MNEDKGKAYKYQVPYEVYFTVEPRDGYKVYMDKDGETEFTELNLATQNVEAPMTLYVLPEKKK